ncbi:MAG TPA: pirin family protein [Rubrivivax sp.]|jgi:redox-sensitive bicupin YhaK (pirin superfamily)|nr:pirin family protein [Burkholderiaceae bacterium]MCP5289190.1 pirin family protein [Burkholderiaceae bacterium]HMR72203.1 pirin family protein [Rubrivivax sp.]
MDTITHPRPVERIVQGQATSDGAGVRLVRMLAQPLQRRLDPFLMLDAFGSDEPRDYLAGFPDHPHRGFETVTLMLAGRMRHRDSAGHEGLLEPGGVQWMTAGRGVVHSEMPEQAEGRMEGLQLWLNLPAADKMREPWYRDFRADEIPAATADGVRVRVIAGRALGTDGAVLRAVTDPLLLDLELAPGARFAQSLPAAHHAFVHVVRGSIEIAGRAAGARKMAILADAPSYDGVGLTAGADGARMLLAAARPLNEPIVQLGPFVMNTREQIEQAVDDFRRGALAN